jgi:hypothetical protein
LCIALFRFADDCESLKNLSDTAVHKSIAFDMNHFMNFVYVGDGRGKGICWNICYIAMVTVSNACLATVAHAYQEDT